MESLLYIGSIIASHIQSANVWLRRFQLFSAAMLSLIFPAITYAAPVIQTNLENQTWKSTNIGVTGTHGNANATQSLHFYPGINKLARQFSLQNITGWGGYLWYVDLQKFNDATHWIFDYDLAIDNPAAAQAIEIDGNQGTVNHRVVYGTECNYRPTNTWRVWQWLGPGNKGQWNDTGIPCSFQTPNHWYHVVFSFERDPKTDNVIYDHLTVTDLTANKPIVDANLHKCFASNPRITKNENSVDIQLDGHRQGHYNVAISKFTVIRE